MRKQFDQIQNSDIKMDWNMDWIPVFCSTQARAVSNSADLPFLILCHCHSSSNFRSDFSKGGKGLQQEWGGWRQSCERDMSKYVDPFARRLFSELWWRKMIVPGIWMNNEEVTNKSNLWLCFCWVLSLVIFLCIQIKYKEKIDRSQWNLWRH